MLPASLSYEMHVPARATGSEPTVVLLGSLGSTRSMWHAQSRGLSERYRVLAIDHRGHGGSELIEGPATMDALAGDVLSVLDSVGVDSAHVVGLSLGGAVAQHLAIHRPERVDSLALLCTAARFGDPAGWTERAATVREKGMDAVTDAVVARWLSPRFAELNPEIVGRLRAMVHSTPAEGYAAACDALAGFDSRAALGGIGVPLLAVAGDVDPSTPPELVREIVDLVGHGRMEVLSPAAHVPTFEHPAQVTSLLLEHLDAAAAPGAR